MNSSVIEDIIWARDNIAKKDCAIIPDKAIIYMNGITDNEYFKERFNFWNNVYGFKMSSMKEKSF